MADFPYRGDFLFHECALFDTSFKDLSDRKRPEGLAVVTETYRRNMIRVRTSPLFLADSIFWAALGGRAAGWVPFITGIPAEDVSRAGGAEALAILDAHFHDTEAQRAEMGRHPFQQRTYVLASNLLEQVATRERRAAKKHGRHGQSGDGIDALYYSMLVGAYAAFEALAVDLWTEAVNLEPKLALNVLKENDERAVKLDILNKYGFDIRNKMGTILKETNKVAFLNLGNVKHAYNRAFKGASKQVFASCPKLDHLEQTRHLIAHRGGLVDTEFSKKMSAVASYPSLVENEYLHFNGVHIREMISDAVKASVGLVQLVDQELGIGSN